MSTSPHFSVDDRMRVIRKLLDAGRDMSDLERLRAVNGVTMTLYRAGEMTYIDDLDFYGHDRFQTAFETMALGHGDCDDYALLKLYLLVRMGVPRSLLTFHFWFGQRANGKTIGHAVIGYGNIWILDWPVDLFIMDAYWHYHAPRLYRVASVQHTAVPSAWLFPDDNPVPRYPNVRRLREGTSTPYWAVSQLCRLFGY